MSLNARFKIVSYELVGMGAFLLLLVWLQLIESNWNSTVVSFGWVYGVIGVTLIRVGLQNSGFSTPFQTRDQQSSRAFGQMSTDVMKSLDEESVRALGPTGNVGKLDSPYLVTGKSGVKHTFTLGARDADSTSLACDVAIGEGPIDETKVLSLFIKVYDVGAKHAVLCAVPSLTDEAKKLAALYKITTVETVERGKVPGMLSSVIQRFGQTT